MTVRYKNEYNAPFLHPFSPHLGAGELGTDQTALWFLSLENPNYCAITGKGYSDAVVDVLAMFSDVGRMTFFKSCSSSIL